MHILASGHKKIWFFFEQLLSNFRYKKQLLIVFWASFEKLFEKLRDTFWKISSNLWKAQVASSVWNFCPRFSDVILQRNQLWSSEISAVFSGYKCINTDQRNKLSFSCSSFWQGNFIALTTRKKRKSFGYGSEIYRQLIQLEKLVSQIGSKSVRTLQHVSPRYFRLVGSTVTQPWKTAKRFKRVNPSLVTAINIKILHNDILQDYKPCLAKLLGSPEYGSKPCNVTEDCWEVMMRPGEIGYVLTHQALYFMFGEQKG